MFTRHVQSAIGGARPLGHDLTRVSEGIKASLRAFSSSVRRSEEGKGDDNSKFLTFFRGFEASLSAQHDQEAVNLEPQLMYKSHNKLTITRPTTFHSRRTQLHCHSRHFLTRITTLPRNRCSLTSSTSSSWSNLYYFPPYR